MRPMSGEVWPTSRSMEDNARSSFNKVGERYTTLRRSMQSLLWCVAFEISLHVWNFCTIYVFLESNDVVKKSNKCYILNMISKHSIRNTTKFKMAEHSICPLKGISYLRSIQNISREKIAAKY
jgi:hypothetical protein